LPVATGIETPPIPPSGPVERAATPESKSETGQCEIHTFQYASGELMASVCCIVQEEPHKHTHCKEIVPDTSKKYKINNL
jgi:hypothetical protein